MATLQFKIYWTGQEQPDTFKVTPKNEKEEIGLMQALRAFNGDYLLVTDNEAVFRCIHTTAPKCKGFTVEEYIPEKEE
jgi:hypothetical protein